jgi:hypothetical protein
MSPPMATALLNLVAVAILTVTVSVRMQSGIPTTPPTLPPSAVTIAQLSSIVSTSAKLAPMNPERTAPTPMAKPNPTIKPSITIKPTDRATLFGSFSFSSRDGDRISIDQAWLKNIITIAVPFNGSIQAIDLNRGIAQSEHEIFGEIEAQNIARGYAYKLHFDGAFVPRRMSTGSGSLSNHAFGIATDLNADTNQMYGSSSDMPSWIIKIFKSHGFVWGGDWDGYRDPMHFEFNVPDTVLAHQSTLEVWSPSAAQVTLIQPDGRRVDATVARDGKASAVWLSDAPAGEYRVEMRLPKAGDFDLQAAGFTADGHGASVKSTATSRSAVTQTYTLTWDGASGVQVTPLADSGARVTGPVP